MVLKDIPLATAHFDEVQVVGEQIDLNHNADGALGGLKRCLELGGAVDTQITVDTFQVARQPVHDARSWHVGRELRAPLDFFLVRTLEHAVERHAATHVDQIKGIHDFQPAFALGLARALDFVGVVDDRRVQVRLAWLELEGSCGNCSRRTTTR